MNNLYPEFKNKDTKSKNEGVKFKFLTLNWGRRTQQEPPQGGWRNWRNYQYWKTKSATCNYAGTSTFHNGSDTKPTKEAAVILIYSSSQMKQPPIFISTMKKKITNSSVCAPLFIQIDCGFMPAIRQKRNETFLLLLTMKQDSSCSASLPVLQI